MKSTGNIDKLILISSRSRRMLHDNVKSLCAIDLDDMKNQYLEKVKEACEKEYSELLELAKDSTWVLSTYNYISVGNDSKVLKFIVPKDLSSSKYSTVARSTLDFISDPLVKSDLRVFLKKLSDEDEKLSRRIRNINSSRYWSELSDDLFELGIKLGSYDEDKAEFEKNPQIIYTKENLASIINSSFTF